MARKKATPRTSANNDMGRDDAATGLNDGTSANDGSAKPEHQRKELPAKRSAGKSATRKGKAGQQMTLSEQQAGEQQDAPQLTEPIPPAGVKGRGSSRRSAVPSRNVMPLEESVGSSAGAAESIPSG